MISRSLFVVQPLVLHTEASASILRNRFIFSMRSNLCQCRNHGRVQQPTRTASAMLASSDVSDGDALPESVGGLGPHAGGLGLVLRVMRTRESSVHPIRVSISSDSASGGLPISVHGVLRLGGELLGQLGPLGHAAVLWRVSRTRFRCGPCSRHHIFKAIPGIRGTHLRRRGSFLWTLQGRRPCAPRPSMPRRHPPLRGRRARHLRTHRRDREGRCRLHLRLGPVALPGANDIDAGPPSATSASGWSPRWGAR